MVRWLMRLPSLLVILIAIARSAFPGESALPAAQPGGSEYIVRVWGSESGLPDNSATSVAQTPDGYIWVGTSGGVFRFNGEKFDPAGKTSPPGLPGEAVLTLYVDARGRLWAGTDSGISVLERGNWRRFGRREGWNGEIARSFADSPAGDVVFGTLLGGVFEIRNGRIESLGTPPGATQSGAFCQFDSDGALWVANRGFLGRRLGTSWVSAEGAAPFRGPIVAGRAQGGGLWILDPSGARKFSGGTETARRPLESIERPWCVVEDSQKNLWVASSQQGVFKVSSTGQVRRYSSRDGLAHNSARSVFEDSEGNIWIATGAGGLCRLTPRRFVTVGPPEGLPESILRTVCEESPGRILFGTHGAGILAFESGRLLPQPPFGSTSHPGAYIWALARDRLGRIWAGTYGDGLFIRDRGVFRPAPADGNPGAAVYALFRDSRDRMWAGGSSGLACYDGDGVRLYTREAGLSCSFIRAIAEDPRTGTLWVGSTEGLYRLDGERFTRFGTREGLPTELLYSLHGDADGTLWVGTHGEGIVRLRNGRFTTIGEPRGGPAGTVTAIVDDGRGALWFASEQGIMRADRTDLEAAADDGTVQLRRQLFDRDDGLESLAFPVGCQPTAILDSNSRLWFSTFRGAASIDPAALRLDRKPPPVHVERVLWESGAGSSLFGSGGQSTQASRQRWVDAPFETPVVLPAGSRQIEIRFTSLSYNAPQKARFQVFLEGRDRQWQSSRGGRFVTYNELAPGNYRFRVRAASSDGTWNEGGAAVELRVLPHWWQIRGVQPLALVLLVLLAGGSAWRVQHNRLVRQTERLEAERRLASERAAAAQSIAASEARLSLIYQSTSDMLALLRVEAPNDFRVESVNRTFVERARLGGIALSEQDIVNRKWTDVLGSILGLEQASVEATVGQIAKALEDGAIVRHEGTHRFPLNVLHHETLHIPVPPNGSGPAHVLEIWRDISARKEAEEVRTRLESQLRHAQKMQAIGTLAGGIAHDFNNILAAIIGFADLARTDARDNKPVVACIDQIGKAGERARSLVQQILTFSRQRPEERRPIRLQPVVAEALSLLRSTVPATIDIVTDIREDAPVVMAEPTQIHQVVMNLCTNSVHAIGDRTGQIRVEVSPRTVDAAEAALVTALRPGRYSILEVTDTGCGMGKDTLDRLFEPFFTTKTRGSGTGLGLPVVLGIVEAHGGAIGVQSEPGCGATFRVYLPQYSGPLPQETVTATPTETGQGEHILFLDDEPAIGEVARRSLERLGYRVTAMTRPEEALELFRESPSGFDLVITDLNMPGMTGIEFATRILGQRPDTPVLLASGFSGDLTVESVRKLGIRGLVMKPLTPAELADTVQRLLAAESPGRDLRGR